LRRYLLFFLKSIILKLNICSSSVNVIYYTIVFKMRKV
jgi:hypothetical protein